VAADVVEVGAGANGPGAARVAAEVAHPASQEDRADLDHNAKGDAPGEQENHAKTFPPLQGRQRRNAGLLHAKSRSAVTSGRPRARSVDHAGGGARVFPTIAVIGTPR